MYRYFGFLIVCVSLITSGCGLVVMRTTTTYLGYQDKQTTICGSRFASRWDFNTDAINNCMEITNSPEYKLIECKTVAVGQTSLSSGDAFIINNNYIVTNGKTTNVPIVNFCCFYKCGNKY